MIFSFSVPSGGACFLFETSAPLYIKKNGHLFHKRTDSGKILVNIPDAGTYKSNFNPVGRQKLLKFDLPSLPPKEKDLNKDKNFFIELDENSANIAKTYAEIGKIVVNKKFTEQSIQVQFFILEHEKGHCYYFDEANADTYAFRQYLKAGYNKSQLLYCLDEILPSCAQKQIRIKTYTKNYLNP
jgi:hypothetical protein